MASYIFRSARDRPGIDPTNRHRPDCLLDNTLQRVFGRCLCRVRQREAPAAAATATTPAASLRRTTAHGHLFVNRGNSAFSMCQDYHTRAKRYCAILLLGLPCGLLSEKKKPGNHRQERARPRATAAASPPSDAAAEVRRRGITAATVSRPQPKNVGSQRYPSLAGRPWYPEDRTPIGARRVIKDKYPLHVEGAYPADVKIVWMNPRDAAPRCSLICARISQLSRAGLMPRRGGEKALGPMTPPPAYTPWSSLSGRNIVRRRSPELRPGLPVVMARKVLTGYAAAA